MKDGLIPWNLPERFLMIIPAPYYVTSLILSLILILIFEFIGERTILQWELENNFVIHIFYIISIAMSLVIGFQLFGIHFF
jgi:hypothetical protein